MNETSRNGGIRDSVKEFDNADDSRGKISVQSTNDHFFKIEGDVDSLTRWGATGWAWIPSAPDLALHIEALLNGEIIARTIASEMRTDLLMNEKGSGLYGFTLVFDNAQIGGHAPVLRAVGPGGSAALRSGEISRIVGYVETLDSEGASGWAWMPEKPTGFLEIEAVLEGKIIGRTIANLDRPDIASSGRGSGKCGFILKFEYPISDNNLPQLRVTDAGYSAVLRSILPPVFVNRSYLASEQYSEGGKTINIVGEIDSLTRWGATGWAWIPNDPAFTLQIQAEVGEKIIGRTSADQMRYDLAKEGKGTGRYGFTLAFEDIFESDDAPILYAEGLGERVALHGSALSSVAGYVDAVTRWGAIGWAWMPDAPEEALEIEAVLDGKIIGRARADQTRLDIAASGRGTGRYGFTLSFAELLPEGKAPLLRAFGPSGQGLLRSDGMITEAEFRDSSSQDNPPPNQDESVAFGLSVEGAVDTATRWGATGWAWTPNDPDQAVKVEAVQDGRVIGHAIADQMRPDLAEHGKGTGLYGFIVAFNEPVLGNHAPIIRVLGPEGLTILPGPSEVFLEPQRLSSEAPTPNGDTRSQATQSSAYVEGSIDLLTRWKAEGWAWMPSAPEQAVQIEALLDGRVVGRAIADQMRPDLAQHGKGTGLYGFKMSFDELIIGNEAPQLRVLAAIGQPLKGVSKLPPAQRDELASKSPGTLANLMKEHAFFTSKGPEFEEFDESIFANAKTKKIDSPDPLLIAFYLPQFHSIPENDLFWGRGFTEWRQLPRGIPRFPGHYQPRIPRDLGFYDLSNLDALRAQCELAKAAGIGAFGFYYYWFNRQRVLDKPLELLLASDLEMPFLLIWANENWTRTWDGSEAHVLLKQDYKAEDEHALLGDLAKHFVDPRYVRVEDRPLFVIYNPKNIPDAAATIARWRRLLQENFQLNPLIFMAQTFGELDPKPFGLDGSIEFPPHKLSNKLPGRPTPDSYSKEFAGRVIEYDDIASASLTENQQPFPLIKTAVPSWDNDARRPNRGLSLENISPKKYEAWLKELILRAIESPVYSTPIVAINAWNEWAESAYLEPDVHFGSSFLNATARAYVSALDEYQTINARKSAKAISEHRVSVVFPNYNHSKYLPERIKSVLEQSLPPDEIIFLDDCSSDNSVAIAREILSAGLIAFQIVLNEKNSGCVFRQWVKGISLARNHLIWIAETDDSADLDFLKHVTEPFNRDDVMASFGKISCIDPTGGPRDDLDNYYKGLNDFSWNISSVVPAFRAFQHDFAIKNVIPNASGLVFRKPDLSEAEIDRLFEYRFAGDWYFYALVTRGGCIAYARKARSYFRVNQSSTSRSSFFTERHLAEHQMVIEDLSREYSIGEEAVKTHSDALAPYLTDWTPETLRDAFLSKAAAVESRTLRICIAANGFAIGGGEILPVELANALKQSGIHITYLVVERPKDVRDNQVRKRLRNDIPVVYWDDVCDDFKGFIATYGIQLINSHNVSVDYRLFLRNLDLGIPYIASLHGGFETVRDLLTDDFLAYLNRTVSKWLYLSEKNLDFLPQSLRDPAKLVYSFNAVAPYEGEWIDRKAFRAEHAIAAEAFVFVQCSRAIESKGWRTSIEIVERLAHRVERPVHLVLIGDGPIAPELKAEYASSPLVTFLGQIDRPIRYFPCFDMGIFPSTFEGETFPLFLLECFQTGLPVATTDIGEIPRIMEGAQGRTPGFLVDHFSTPETLAEELVVKLEEMLMTAGTYDDYCVGVFSTSRRFAIGALASLYAETFTESRLYRIQ